MLIGYKINCICREINDFALHGNLPSQRSIKCKHIMIGTIWALTFTYLVLDLSLTTYWRFDIKHGNLKAADTFDFVDMWIQALLFIFVSALYLSSARLLSNLQKNLHSKESQLVNSTRIVWLLFGSYTVIWMSLLYSTYT